MSHLITPVNVNGTMYCCLYTDGRRTKGVITDVYASGNTAVITTDEGPWTLLAAATSDEYMGEISFGVSCGSQITLNIDVNVSSPQYVAVVAYLDFGSTIEVAENSLSGTGNTMVIDISEVPCGVVVTLVCQSPGPPDQTSGLLVTASITSIT